MIEAPIQRYADLHLHTRCSDGTYSPEQLVEAARHCGFAAIAVTDHDSVEACTEVAALCQLANIEFLSGVELTAEHQGNELHFLGYCVDVHHPVLLENLAKFQAVRQNRILQMVGLINHLDVPLMADDVFALANCRSPGRLHVGRALVKGGFCANQDEAFDRFLRRNRPAWVPKYKISALEAIQLIHLAGGVAVMAHPGLNRDNSSLPEIAMAGLDGLECYHSKHSPSATTKFLDFARGHNLLITGGSDCHGRSKDKPTMGSVKLPYEHIEKLKSWVYSRNSKMA